MYALEPGKAWLICKYHQDGGQVELWERPDGSRFRQFPSGATLETRGPTDVDAAWEKHWQGKSKNFHTYVPVETCKHTPKPLTVGDLTFYPFAMSDTQDAQLAPLSHLFTLNGTIPTNLYHAGFKGVCYGVPCPDQGTLPAAIHAKLINNLVKLAPGGKIGFYCTGGHGRTGTVLASLIGKLEGVEDPIAAVRTRYCKDAVESQAQAECIFTFLGKPLPELYKNAFKVVSSMGTSTDHYGFDIFKSRVNQADIPEWFRLVSTRLTPFISELDKAIKTTYKTKVLPMDTVGPLSTGYPGIAPAVQPGYYWLVDRETGAAVRVAFTGEATDGEIVEVVPFLDESLRPYVLLEKPKVNPLELELGL